MDQEAQLTTADPRPDYGLDSPRLLKASVASGIFAILMGLVLQSNDRIALILTGSIAYMWILGVAFLARAGLMAYHGFAGKLKERDALMASLRLRGDERILDIGCGRGLLLIAIAKRLTTGKAVGIDTWNSTDLSDNWSEGTWENADMEGVTDRIEVVDGDMRQMAFESASFDMVVSCNAIACLTSADQKRHAVDEIFRVLKPGGRVNLIEPGLNRAVISALNSRGFDDIRVSPWQFTLFPPARRISAKKPQSAVEEPLRYNTHQLLEGDITQFVDRSTDSGRTPQTPHMQ